MSMLTHEEKHPSQFLDALQTLFAEIKGDDSLKAAREKAWQYFIKLGLPQRKQESFQYIPLRKLYQNFSLHHANGLLLEEEQISSYIYPECKDTVLVFVNGSFSPRLSKLEALPSQVVVLPLNEAMRTYGSFLNNRLNKTLHESTDSFAVLNTALHSQGVFVFIPARTKLQKPIQFLHFMDTQKASSSVVHPRVHLFLGREAEADCITSYHGIFPLWVNSVTDIALEEGARCKNFNLMLQESDHWQFDMFQTSQKRNSSFSSVSISCGTNAHRQSFHALLSGENAETHLKGLWMLNQHKQAHVHVVVDHQAPFTRSQQLFKGILDDASQSSFEGKILVRSAAQKTEAYQLNNNLILGSASVANSKPNLEIFADDVKASHGATIAQLDAELLFYLKTRGLSPVEAKTLLIEAYCKEVIGHIHYASLKEEVNGLLAHYLGCRIGK